MAPAQAAAAAAASAEPTAKPELLSPGTTIALSDVHDVILHALIDAVAPKWLRLQARYVRLAACIRLQTKMLSWFKHRRQCREWWCLC